MVFIAFKLPVKPSDYVFVVDNRKWVRKDMTLMELPGKLVLNWNN